MNSPKQMWEMKVLINSQVHAIKTMEMGKNKAFPRNS